MTPSLHTALLTLLTLLPVLVRLTLAQKCEGSTAYRVNVSTFFTQEFDYRIPDSEKTSIPILVAVAHSPDFVLFRLSRLLNDSVAEVATSGTAARLSPSLSLARDQGQVSDFVILDDVPTDGRTLFNLRVSDSASRISVIAQLSPSPSWFLGIDSFDVCQSVSGSSSSDFVATVEEEAFGNYNAGLDRGQSFDADPDPYDSDSGVPVAEVDSLSGTTLAEMSLVRSSSGKTNWWPIVLGVLLAVLLLFIISIFVVPRILRARRSKQQDYKPSPERVDW